jgi:hypothetical protein
LFFPANGLMLAGFHGSASATIERPIVTQSIPLSNRISTFSYELFDGMQLVANIYHCIAPYAIEPDWDDVYAPAWRVSR